MSRDLIGSIEQEYRRYKAYGDGALAQLPEEHFGSREGAGNSMATIVWHVSGNLRSRFTDFLTSDGEKAWRDRDDEFVHRGGGRDEVTAKWEEGWAVLLATLAELTDADLTREVTIRRRPLPVHEALHRSLAHTASHVGQMVHIGKRFSGDDWDYLSIAPGGSAAYNADPTLEAGFAEPTEDR